MKNGALWLALALMGCSSPQTVGDVGAPNPSATSSGLPLAGSARVSQAGEGRDECAGDADCQLVPTCDCERCIASKQMEVGLCGGSPCTTNRCEGLRPRCDSGHCNATVTAPPKSGS